MLSIPGTYIDSEGKLRCKICGQVQFERINEFCHCVAGAIQENLLVLTGERDTARAEAAALRAALDVARQEIVDVEHHGVTEIQKLKSAIMDIYENGQDGKWDEETILVLDKLYPDDRD